MPMLRCVCGAARWLLPLLLLLVGSTSKAASALLPAPAGLLPQRGPVAAAADGWLLGAEMADFSAVDATPARAFAGDWAGYQPRNGRNLALQSSHAAFSATRQHWELAATLRSGILIDGSRGAFDAVFAYKQRSTPADGSRLVVDVQAQGLLWAGLRGARTWSLAAAGAPGLQLTAAASLLSVRRLQQDAAQGVVAYSAAGGYAFDAGTLRQDSRRSFGGDGPPQSSGSGFSTDLGLHWQPASGWMAGGFATLSAVDVLSRLRVQGVATEQTTLSSATRSTDADGYLDYKPLALGRYSTSNLRLQASRKWSATLGVTPAALGASGLAGLLGPGALLGARWERLGTLNLPALWATLPLPVLPAGLALQLDADARFHTLGFGLAGRHGVLLLRSQSLRVGQSRAVGWQARLELPL